MRPARVATAFLCSGGRVLLVRRSGRVRTMRGLWGGVSGSVEGGESPLVRARAEILEELGAGAGGARLLGAAAPLLVSSPAHGGEWEVFPFLFGAPGGAIELNWENSEYRWVRPGDVAGYDTVPGLGEALSRLL